MVATQSVSMSPDPKAPVTRIDQIVLLLTRERLTTLVMRILMRIGAPETVGAHKEKLRQFVLEACDLYHANPYHNWRHAVDITYTVACFVSRTSLKKKLDPVDTFWLLIAALVHDIDHPGNNNDWEAASHSGLYAKYQGSAVLERHSIDVTASLLARPECRFTDGMPAAVRSRGESLLPELIRATDFADHARFVSVLNQAAMQFPRGVNFDQPAFTLLVLQALLKAADIGNTTKPFVKAYIWAHLVLEEFWAQGDREKLMHLPVGPLNDRHRASIYDTQIGFIRNVALNLYEPLARIEPGLKPVLSRLSENIDVYAAQKASSMERRSNSASCDCAEFRSARHA